MATARPIAAPKPRARLALPALSTHALGLILVPFAAVVVALAQPADFDYWWHRRTGEYIVHNLALPRSDPFAFTTAGKTWVDHEWLSQVLMYGAESLVGYLGLFLLCMALGVAAWALIYRLLRREGLSEFAALALSIAPAAFGATYWRARPAMFTVFFVALLLFETYAARRGERRTLWRLVPVMLIWANLHGGYVIGFALIAAFAAAQWWDRAAARGPSWRHIAIAGIIAFALTGLNPYSYKLWEYPLTYLGGSNASLAQVDEWQSPDFHQLRNLPLAALLLSAMLIGANGRRFDAWRTLLVLLFGAMALQSLRHQPLFALVWPCAIGPSLLERWPAFGRGAPPRARATALNYGLLAAGVAALITVVAISPDGIPLRSPPKGGSPPYPVAGAAYIEQHQRGARVFNLYEWGGYLIDRLYPHERVFIDGRADLHGDLVPEYDAIVRGKGWQQAFDRYSVTVALLPPQLPVVEQLRAAGWTTGYEDADQVVLVKPR